jgi:hypothetical protein
MAFPNTRRRDSTPRITYNALRDLAFPSGDSSNVCGTVKATELCYSLADPRVYLVNIAHVDFVDYYFRFEFAAFFQSVKT